MNKDRPTLAVYGIQDRTGAPFPWFVHDHAIVLMHKGRVLKALTLERQTRIKHDNSLHKRIYDILKSEGLLADRNYDLVFVDNVAGRAFISQCGRFRFEAPLVHTPAAGIEKGKCWWLDRETEAYALNHELAHIAANLPFYGNFKENSLLVHFDGGASVSNFSAWLFKDGKITRIEAHWKLKRLTSMFNANALVFGIIGARMQEQNSVPGKMMGLAGYGSYSEELERWLTGNNFFEDIWNKKTLFFEKARKSFGWDKTHLHTDDPFLQDIIATMHHIFVRETISYFSELQKKTGTDNLYYSGGSALNIVTNTALHEAGLFRDIFIPPSCEDSGLALGAAAFIEWQKHGSVELHSPYLLNWGIDKKAPSYTNDDIEKAAQLLMQKKVIGICNGNAEIGPRALGNRSIIALAGSKALAKRVSMGHKKREWYRPVAPVMLEKNAKYFTGGKDIHHLSRFMLLDFPVLPEKRKEMEGAVHVDGTARIQTFFDRSGNPYIFDLLTLLDKKYGVKALINTSFNIRGEPIVHTCDDAVKSAKSMKLDAVVLNGKLSRLSG
jgi:carbamoyltransferase